MNSTTIISRRIPRNDYILNCGAGIETLNSTTKISNVISNNQIFNTRTGIILAMNTAAISTLTILYCETTNYR